MFKVRGVKSIGFATDMLIAGGNKGTAMEAAFINGNLELIKLLVEHGADPNVQSASFQIPRICS
jgi:hypothetical protein